LNAASTEAAHSNKNVNAEQTLGEQSEEFYSYEICSNIPSGNAGVSNRETTFYCEMCVVSLTHKPILFRGLRGSERPFYAMYVAKDLLLSLI
jgi:hypothetical protein